MAKKWFVIWLLGAPSSKRAERRAFMEEIS
jgi:hypothetical protein